RFHSGMASIAMMAGVDILPIAVLNSRELPHTTEPPAVLIGRPIHVKKQKPDKASIEAINQQVRAAIEQMAEEYRNRQKN
ncbi:MAG: 1-acyl-sn-glycerol-3-phosphate acyltransferase, partial [Allisonella histaminiformans]|nr:1-acyl-sn-glycerol-3-phosphate acyltransferase [Allisonella histaminiformans]